MAKICVVSSCLAGIACRYDGDDNLVPEIYEMVMDGSAIPVCPEVLGGLPTPRIPAEIVVGNDGTRRVINRDGEDVTDCFVKGAEATLAVARAVGAETAILKQRSPSCGCGQTYDGTFSKTLTEANGVTVELLLENGISVRSEEDEL